MAKKQNLSENIKNFLDDMGWPETLSTNEIYTTEDDDSEPGKGNLMIQFSNDGDAWVNIFTDPPYKSIRKRTFIGGGKDEYTRKALLILAEAIRIDNERNIEK